jgi:hypothetical protein
MEFIQGKGQGKVVKVSELADKNAVIIAPTESPE